MWSRFQKSDDTKDTFKYNLYGHIGGFKSMSWFRREMVGKLDLNLPVILIDNDQSSLSKGGFDHSIDISKYSQSMVSSSIIVIDSIFLDVSSFILTWRKDRRQQREKEPAKKRIKWNC